MRYPRSSADGASILQCAGIICRLVLGCWKGQSRQEPLGEGAREDPVEDQDLHPACADVIAVVLALEIRKSVPGTMVHTPWNGSILWCA